MVRVELTREQYGVLMRLVQREAMKSWDWEMTPDGMVRDSEYTLVVEILEALRRGREGE